MINWSSTQDRSPIYLSVKVGSKKYNRCFLWSWRVGIIEVGMLQPQTTAYTVPLPYYMPILFGPLSFLVIKINCLLWKCTYLPKMFKNYKDLCDVVSLLVYCPSERCYLFTKESSGETWLPSSKCEKNCWKMTAHKINFEVPTVGQFDSVDLD